jgi:predicted secreted protein
VSCGTTFAVAWVEPYAGSPIHQKDLTMRLATLLAVTGLSLVSLAAVACGSSTADDAAQSDEATTSDGAEQEVKAAVFGEADDGKTVSVISGRSFTIALSENASTGYVWKVTSVDRSLGYPKETSVPGPANRPGSPGVKKLTWSTKSPLGLVGKHDIKLALVRPFEKEPVPSKTFALTVDITDATQAKDCGGIVPLRCGANEYCEYTPAQACGAGDQTGTCQPKGGQFCPALYLPVCGCDGKTYGNSCEANRAGTSVAKDGACAGQATSCGDATCQDGDVCCNPLMGICTPPGGVCIQ